MNEKINKIKKKLAVILILSFSINSFATSINVNDGSAFITKAEFDALKSSFQTQLDSYNQGIDSKIDSAIASYLSGVRISKVKNLRLPYADWQTIEFGSDPIKNDWKLSTINLTYEEIYEGQFSDANARQTWYCVAMGSYDKPEADYQKRLLCNAGPESTTIPKSITWSGLAENYKEKINISVINMNTQGERGKGPLSKLNESGTKTLSACYFTKLAPGYYPEGGSWNIKTLWEPKLYFYNSGGSAAQNGYRVPTTELAKTVTFAIEVNKNNLNKDITHKHYLIDGNSTWDKFSDSSWTSTLAKNSSTETYNTLLTKLTKKGTWSSMTSNLDTDPPSGYGTNDANLNAFYSGSYGNADNNTMVSIGVIDKTYDSAHIYQTDEDFTQIIDEKVFTATRSNLYNGLLLMAANKDDVVTWKPKFTSVTNDGEIDIMLATEKFGEKDNVATNSIIKVTGAKENKVTTKEQKITLKFTMPTDGVVYMKCWPHDSSLSSWIIELDLTSCSTYEVENR